MNRKSRPQMATDNLARFLWLDSGSRARKGLWRLSYQSDLISEMTFLTELRHSACRYPRSPKTRLR
jgi:hypothetical protein